MLVFVFPGATLDAFSCIFTESGVIDAYVCLEFRVIKFTSKVTALLVQRISYGNNKWVWCLKLSSHDVIKVLRSCRVSANFVLKFRVKDPIEVCRMISIDLSAITAMYRGGLMQGLLKEGVVDWTAGSG